MDSGKTVHAPIAQKSKTGLEISPGVFVVNKGKFLTTQLNGLKSKSKIVRNASRLALIAYSLKTGEEIVIPSE